MYLHIFIKRSSKISKLSAGTTLSITLCNTWTINSLKDSTKKCSITNFASKHLTPSKIKILYFKMMSKSKDLTLKIKFHLKKSPKNTQGSQLRLKKLKRSKKNLWRRRQEPREVVKERISQLRFQKRRLKLSNILHKRRMMKCRWFQ